jgi:hypothetical protein
MKLSKVVAPINCLNVEVTMNIYFGIKPIKAIDKIASVLKGLWLPNIAGTILKNR